MIHWYETETLSMVGRDTKIRLRLDHIISYSFPDGDFFTISLSNGASYNLPATTFKWFVHRITELGPHIPTNAINMNEDSMERWQEESMRGHK